MNIKKNFETSHEILSNTAKLHFFGLVIYRVSKKKRTKIRKKRDFDAPPGLAMGPRRVKLWSHIDNRSNYLYMEFRPLILIFRGSKSVKTSYNDARGTIPLNFNMYKSFGKYLRQNWFIFQ